MATEYNASTVGDMLLVPQLGDIQPHKTDDGIADWSLSKRCGRDLVKKVSGFTIFCEEWTTPLV